MEKSSLPHIVIKIKQNKNDEQSKLLMRQRINLGSGTKYVVLENQIKMLYLDKSERINLAFSINLLLT